MPTSKREPRSAYKVNPWVMRMTKSAKETVTGESIEGDGLSIGVLAEKTDVTAEAIRYFA